MNIFLLYFVLLMILLIRSARSMSFDLPFYGYDSYMDTYLDNTNDEISEDGQRNQNANEQVTIEPQPLLLYSTTSPYKSNPSYENADCGRDENDCCDSNNTRKKATYIAQNAAQVAKAANEAQAAAAEDASRRVKMQLADKAICAARAANAVLAGKKIVVDNYAREIGEAESVVDQVSISLERSEENAEAACSAAKTAENETNSFRAQVEQTRAILSDIDDLIENNNADLQDNTQMLKEAMARGDYLTRQVAVARSEYGQVKEAACRAACAAVEAKQKAGSSDDVCGPSPAPPPRTGGCGSASDSKECNALLELYRQRRRQQQRQRREKLKDRADHEQGQYREDHFYDRMRSIYR